MIGLNDFLRALEDVKQGPTTADLEEAPILNPWRILQDKDATIFRLYGGVQNHPTIDDEFLTTSPLIAFDLEGG